MAKLHIVGIGGTGHKVLTSIIHLAACGAFNGKLGSTQIESMRVLTIDADDANGNLINARETLESYQNFHKAIKGNKFGLIAIEAISPKVNLSLYDDKKNSIRSIFKTSKYEEHDEDKLLRFLYTDNEIDTEIKRGFYGHTSIGTLIVEHVLNTHEMWNDFCGGIHENDFVIVLGSIFGGTGASIIPVVLDKLNNHENRNGFKLTSLMLTPYFKTTVGKKEDGLQPDWKNFHIKAKAALHYYSNQKKNERDNNQSEADAIYIIGEPKENFSTELYSSGSTTQDNKAHPVELFAATAMLDFISETTNRTGGRIITADRDYDPQRNLYCYTWEMLKDISPNLPAGIQHFLKASVFFNKIIYTELRSNSGSGIWPKYYSDLGNYEIVYTYLKLFTKWMFDLHKKNREEIDPNTGKLKWDFNETMRLFLHREDIYDNNLVENCKIENFDELVYKKTIDCMAEKIYFKINTYAKNDGDLGALYATILEIIEELETREKINQTKPDNYERVRFLSEVKKGSIDNRPKPEDGKLWVDADPGILVSIANNLPESNKRTFSLNDVSIPSSWAIFIVNELALMDAKFAALNNNAYNQWCGLIALLALRKFNHYEDDGLLLHELNLEMKPDESHPDFVGTVKKAYLKPKSCIFPEQPWDKYYLVTLKVPEYDKEGNKKIVEKTIASLADNTLVCPVYSFDEHTKKYLNRIAPGIFNRITGFLHPKDYFNQQHDEDKSSKHALSEFLNELPKVIKSADNNPIISELRGKIQAFINDLGLSADKEGYVPQYEPSEIKSVHDIFQELSPESRNNNIEPAFLLEGTLPGKNIALLGLNVCGISCDSSDAASIYVTQNLKFCQIDAQKLQELSRTTLDDGTYLLDVNNLLTDSLMLVSKNNNELIFPATLPIHGKMMPEYQIVMPINDMLLEFYPVDKLNDMVAISMDKNTVTITLTLKTRKRGSHVIEKKYDIDSTQDIELLNKEKVAAVFSRTLLPLWAIWPYAKITAKNSDNDNIWKLYHYFCVDPVSDSGTVFEIDPVFKNKDVRIEPYTLSARRNDNNAGAKEVIYRQSSDLPVALRIMTRRDNQSICRGVVFLDPPVAKIRGTMDWNIGLDFGATSTTVFYTSKNDDVQPRFIQLLNEYDWKKGKQEEKDTLDFGLCVLCNNESDMRHLDIHFIDRHCFGQKAYATAYEIEDDAHDDSIQIFKTGRIFWQNYDNFNMIDRPDPRRDRIHANIKWETDYSLAGKYLNQLMTQIVFYAIKQNVGTINWFFSYPTAFGDDSKSKFKEKLENIIDGLRNDTGIKHDFGEKNLLTESIAAAYYFRKKKDYRNVFCCIDIGGSTSDISVWLGENNVFQSSVRFASWDMLVRPLANLLKKSSVMDAVTTQDPEDGIHVMLNYTRGSERNDPLENKFFIEAVLFEYSQQLKERLYSLVSKKKVDKEDKKAFENFQYFVLIAYSGLVYYLANIIAELLKTNKQRSNSIMFCLSGKGSKLTNWIEAYREKIYKQAEMIVKEKTGKTIRFIIDFDENHAKNETAIGMISDTNADKGKNNLPEVYLGSDITVMQRGKKSRTIKRNAFIRTNKEFPDIDKIEISLKGYLTELDEFVNKFFDPIANKTNGLIKPIDKNWYTKEMTEQLKVYSNTQIKNIIQKEKRFESPFIVVLSVFLEEYTDYCK